MYIHERIVNFINKTIQTIYPRFSTIGTRTWARLRIETVMKMHVSINL